MSRNYPSPLVILTLNPSPLVILSPSLLVILSEAKNLISLRVNSTKNLMVLRASSVKGKNLASTLTLRVTKSLKGLLTYS